MPDPASIFGKSKSKGAELDDDEGEEAEMPPDFEDYAIQAFPELEDSPERLIALRKLIKSCK